MVPPIRLILLLNVCFIFKQTKTACNRRRFLCTSILKLLDEVPKIFNKFIKIIISPMAFFLRLILIKWSMKFYFFSLNLAHFYFLSNSISLPSISKFSFYSWRIFKFCALDLFKTLLLKIWLFKRSWLMFGAIYIFCSIWSNLWIAAPLILSASAWLILNSTRVSWLTRLIPLLNVIGSTIGGIIFEPRKVEEAKFYISKDPTVSSYSTGKLSSVRWNIFWSNYFGPLFFRSNS